MATRGIFRGINRARHLGAQSLNVASPPPQQAIFEPVPSGLALGGSASLRTGVRFTNATTVTVTEGDPHYDDVLLLLPFSGANGSTILTDYSPSPKTVTAHGNAAISNAQTLFGENTLYFDGSDDYVSVNSPINLGGEFTIEFPIYTAHRNNRIIGNRSAANGYLITTSLNNGQYKIIWNQWVSDAYSSAIGGIYTANQFVHVAICRDASGYVAIFVGGIGNTPVALPAPGSSTNNLDIGRDVSTPSSDNFQGYLGPVRITDYCRYTENFTPPSAPFPTTGAVTVYSGATPLLTLGGSATSAGSDPLLTSPGASNDSLLGEVACAFLETGAATDALTGGATTLLADSLRAQTPLTGVLAISGLLADTQSATTLLSAYQAGALNDTATAVDSLTTAATASLDDTSNSVDALTGALALGATVSDTATSLTVLGSYMTTKIADTSTVSDALTAHVAARLADTATGVDTLQGALAISGALTESVTTTDNLLAAMRAQVTETATGTETLNAAMTAAVADTATASTPVTGALALTVLLAETGASEDMLG